MRFIVAYPFYLASAEMCVRVVDGLIGNLDPELAEVVFLLDGNDAEHRDAIGDCEPQLRQSGLKWKICHTESEIRDMACHNYFIDHMMDTEDVEAVIVSQDDIYFKNNSLLGDLGRVLDEYGDRIGMVGLRHGCDRKNSNLICALFDVDTHETYASHKVTTIPVGGWAERLLLTPGPLVYPRKAVKAIGRLDHTYRDWWWWSDYCMRAHLAGLKNVVLSIDALHFKCGKTKHSHVAINTNVSAADLKLFNDRYRHVFGEDIL